MCMIHHNWMVVRQVIDWEESIDKFLRLKIWISKWLSNLWTQGEKQCLFILNIWRKWVSQIRCCISDQGMRFLAHLLSACSLLNWDNKKARLLLSVCLTYKHNKMERITFRQTLLDTFMVKGWIYHLVSCGTGLMLINNARQNLAWLS